MAIDRYIVKFRNTEVAADNYQLCDLSVDPSLTAATPAYIAAALGLYFWNLFEIDCCAAGTSMEGITYVAAGGGGGVPVVFPGTEQTAILTAAIAAGFTVTGPSGYSDAGGAGGLAPLGTSISVSETTGFPGRTGRGRHFLPYVSENAVDAAGFVAGAKLTGIPVAWKLFIWGRNPSTLAPIAGLTDIRPVVSNAAGTSSHAITGIKPQPIFSNLESRRR